MSKSFRVTRLVEFCDTDAAGIAHFSAFFRYMEQAEHALWREVGSSVVTQDAEGTISWPRVSAHCDYAGAVRFEDQLEVQVVVERIGARSVTFRFDFSSGGAAVATGRMTSVCCRMAHDRPPQAMPIPATVRQLLEPYLQP